MMSAGGGGGGGSRGNAGPIPAGTKTIVQSLKEIVNCTDQEIYAALKECNMDPNEAVNRLISQDTFHEVKSKREKKKEVKETPESRSQKASSSSNRGVKGGTDRGGRNNTILITSNDYGVSRGKTVHKKESESNTVPTSILGSSIMADYSSRRLTPVSNSDSIESPIQSTGPSDSLSLPSQPSSTFSHSWSGMRGHLSMADIVKMGRPQGKPSTAPVVTTDVSQSYTSHNVVMSNTLHDSAKYCQVTASLPQTNWEFHSQDVSKITESSHEPGIIVGQHTSLDEWSLVDQSPTESGQFVAETLGTSSISPEPPASSILHVDGDDKQSSLHLDDIQVLEGNVDGERVPTESTRSASVLDKQMQVDNYSVNSCLDDGSLNNMSSYMSPMTVYESHKDEDVNGELSMATANLQQISLHTEQNQKSATSKPAVIIPDHLQVTADCSHLSFGSFGSGISASLSGAFTSKPLKSTMEVPSVRDSPSSIDHSEARESEYYDTEQLQSTSNDSAAPTTGTSTGNYDLLSVSHPEVIRDDTLDASHRLQHNSPSVSGYAFPSTAQPNTAAYAHAESNSQMQYLAPFSNSAQSFTDSLPSNMLASAAQPFHEFDLPFLPLLSTQSMSEAVKPGIFSVQPPTLQNVPSTSASTSPTLPQHLPVHAYSQPTLPLGHFPNMIGYPFLSQNLAYMPSAFQQAYSGSSAFHHSPAALNSAGFKSALPQFKSSYSVSTMPPSATGASGYEGFGSSANIPGSFTQNPTAASASASVYEEALGSQHREGHHYLPLHQNENSLMWAHGVGSRTVPSLPTGTYYGFQGQNQQSGVRQGHQPSHFGGLGYPTLYHSQAGISQEHQQRPSEGNLNASQGSGSQQSHHSWQHNY